MSAKYVAYYRVSTQRQGVSGLGLEAQRAAVGAYTGSVLGEYVEVESGRRHDNRPELDRALAHCRSAQAVLLIAKLDRLSRNVAFLASLMESGVEIMACDMPQANRFTLHVLAAVAEQESRMISDRTRAAIKARLARGKPWDHVVPPRGTPERALKARAARARQLEARKADFAPVVSGIKERGVRSMRGIAEELNRMGYVGLQGGKFHASSVRGLLLDGNS